jgi:hypothetical protein
MLGDKIGNAMRKGTALAARIGKGQDFAANGTPWEELRLRELLWLSCVSCDCWLHFFAIEFK